jgi:phosphoribosylformylglycinamidine synthase
VHHTAVCGVVRSLVAGGMAAGLHDVSGGGIGVALAELAVRSGIGVNVARVADVAELFAESPSRVVACVTPELLVPVERALDHAGVPFSRIGVATGDRISIKGLVDLDLADAEVAWRERLPARLGVGTTQG